MAEQFDPRRPIYLQLTERFTRKIIAGEYAPGARLAPVRELATEFGVNPNTLQRAFADLERAGLLYTERTAGRFVTQDETVIAAVRNQQAMHMIQAFADQMAQMGFTKAQVIALLQQEVTDLQAVDAVDAAKVAEPTQPEPLAQPAAPAQAGL